MQYTSLPSSFQNSLARLLEEHTSLLNNERTSLPPDADWLLEHVVDRIIDVSGKTKDEFEAMPQSKDPIFVSFLKKIAQAVPNTGRDQQITVTDEKYGEFLTTETWNTGGIPVLTANWNKPTQEFQPVEMKDTLIDQSVITKYGKGENEDVSSLLGQTMPLPVERDVKPVVREGLSLRDLQSRLAALF